MYIFFINRFPLLEQFFTMVQGWEPIYTERDGGADEWYAKCKIWINDTEAIRETVANEIVKHKLEKITDEGFIC